MGEEKQYITSTQHLGSTIKWRKLHRKQLFCCTIKKLFFSVLQMHNQLFCKVITLYYSCCLFCNESKAFFLICKLNKNLQQEQWRKCFFCVELLISFAWIFHLFLLHTSVLFLRIFSGFNFFAI